MIHSAIISGSIAQALFRDDAGLWLIPTPGNAPLPADQRDAAMFHNIALEVCDAVPDGMPIDLATLNKKLDREVKFARALRGLLIGMDGDFDENLRRKNIAAANALLIDNEHLLDDIRHRMFVPTNSQEWDPARALTIADRLDASRAADIYRPIADGTVDRVIDALSSAVIDLHGSGVKSMSVRDGLQKAGLTARITALVSAKDVKGLKSLAFTFKKYPAIAALDPNGRISVKVANALAASIEQSESPAVVARPQKTLHLPINEPAPDSESGLHDAVLAFLDKWRRRKDKGHPNEIYDLEAIQREVDWIAARLYAGELQKAEVALIKLIGRQDRRSDPDHLAMSLTNVAGHARNAGLFDFCLAILDAIDLMDARDAAAADLRGEVLSDLGQHDDALALFEEAMARFPESTSVRNSYGKLLRKMGRHDNALAVFEETMERFSNDQFARNSYGELLREMGRHADALIVFEDTIAQFSNDPFARNSYGELLREMGRHDDALTVFEQAMARFSDDAVLWNSYAELLREMGRHTDALAVFEETLTRFSNDVVVRNSYGELLREMGRHDDALAVFEETLARFSNDEFARNSYGELLREMGRHDDALAMFEETIARFSNNAVVRNSYGELLREMGCHDDALAVFEKTMARFSQDLFARNCYGELLREIGRYDDAVAVFEETMARFPRDSVSRNSLAHLHIERGEFESAENLLILPAVPILVNDWIALHILGMCQLRKGDTAKAVELFEKGLNTPFLHVFRYFAAGLAMAQLAHGNPERARSAIDPIRNVTGEQKHVISLLDAHIHGALGDHDGADIILRKLPSESLNKDETSLAEALKQYYVVKSIPMNLLSAANDNILALETKIIFRSFNRMQQMQLAA